MKDLITIVYGAMIALFMMFIVYQQAELQKLRDHLAILDLDIRSNANIFDDVVNDLYHGQEKHETMIRILSGEPPVKMPTANDTDTPTDAVLDAMYKRYQLDSFYRVNWHYGNVSLKE